MNIWQYFFISNCSLAVLFTWGELNTVILFFFTGNKIKLYKTIDIYNLKIKIKKKLKDHLIKEPKENNTNKYFLCKKFNLIKEEELVFI